MGRKDTPPEQIISPVGAMLRAMRTAKGLTLSEMVVKVGKSKGHLSNVENGNVAPSRELLQDYWRALDLTTSEYKSLVAAMHQSHPNQFRMAEPLLIDATLDLDDLPATAPFAYDPPVTEQNFSQLNKGMVWRDLAQNPTSSSWELCEAFIDHVVQGYVAEGVITDQEVTTVLSNLMLAVHTDLPTTYHGSPSLSSWLISRAAQAVAKIQREKKAAEEMLGRLQHVRESGEQNPEITEALNTFCRKQRDPARVALVLNLAMRGKHIPDIAASTKTSQSVIVHLMLDVQAYILKIGVVL